MSKKSKSVWFHLIEGPSKDDPDKICLSIVQHTDELSHGAFGKHTLLGKKCLIVVTEGDGMDKKSQLMEGV